MGAIKLNCSRATSIQHLLGVRETNQFNLLAPTMFLMPCVTVSHEVACPMQEPCFSFSLFSIHMDLKDNLDLG